MNIKPTPETDAADGKPTWQENIIEKGWVPADFARRLERERDAERALADRLAGALELYYADDAIAHHAGIADALAAWKEARSD